MLAVLCVPEFRELGALIRERLSLPATTDVVAMLHSSISSTPARLTLTAPDGSEFNGLFNRFTAASNPVWRKA